MQQAQARAENQAKIQAAQALANKNTADAAETQTRTKGMNTANDVAARAAAAPLLAKAWDSGDQATYARAYYDTDPAALGIAPPPDKYDAKKDSSDIGFIDSALTPAQSTTAANTAATLQAAEAYRKASLAIQQQRANQQGDRINNGTPAQQYKAQVQQQANRVVSESAQAGGTSIDDAIRNAQKFYQGDPDLEPVRGDVVNLLQQWKKTQKNANTTPAKSGDATIDGIWPGGLQGSLDAERQPTQTRSP